MIKLDVGGFLLGIAAVTAGLALIDMPAGPWLFVPGCALLAFAPAVTVIERREARQRERGAP